MKGILLVYGMSPEQTACSYVRETLVYHHRLLAADVDQNTADTDELKLR